MFCYKCGHELPNESNFCCYCGTDLTGTEKAAQQQATQQMQATLQEPKGKRKKKKSKKGLVAVLLVAVLMVAAAGGAVAFGGVDMVRAKWQIGAGDRYLDDLEYEQAIAAFEEAIDIDPKQVDAYKGLAEAYAAMGEYEKAIEVLDDGTRMTESESLYQYREDLLAEWYEATRGFAGYVYKVDTDLDAHNNEPLANATITLTAEDGTVSTYVSDEEGYYETAVLPVGTYTINFQLDGYAEYEETFELTEGRLDLDVFIEPLTYTTLFGSVSIADTDTNYSNNYPLSGVDITLEKLNASNAYEATVVSDANGYYEADRLLMGVYHMTISKDGYITTEQNVVVYEGQEASYNVMIEVIDESYEGTGTASGMIYDALTGEGVPELTLSIREGISEQKEKKLLPVLQMNTEDM